MLKIPRANGVIASTCKEGDYLEVKEFAVSSVDDVGGVVRVGDIDEVHLPREEEQSLNLSW